MQIWHRWLSVLAVTRSQNAGRKRPSRTSLPGLENLECRTLLTANLPVAVDDPGYVVSEDATLNGSTVIANDTDADAGNVIDQAVLQTTTTHGTLTLNPDGTFVYVPAANFHGTDSFTYFARDSLHNETGTQAGTVTITVASVPDTPIAQSASLTTNEDIPLNGTLSGNDPDGNSVTFLAGSSTTTHGSLVLNSNGTFTYTPQANFNGTDFFTFKVNDGTDTSSEATVLITVTPVNDAPTANSTTETISEDTVLHGTLSGSDPESNALTYSVGTVTPTHGTVTINTNGSFTYSPNANFSGTDLFTFKVNDGQANSAEASVLITVTAVDDAPTANPVSITTPANTAFSGTLTGSDPENNSLTFAVVNAPAHGSVTINANGTYTYSPSANFTGSDSFTFRVNDGNSNSASATVSVTVTPVNGAPTANPVSITTPVNTTVNGTLTGSDPENNPLTFAVVNAPTHGSVTINPNGTYSYSPSTNYTGSDSFTFRVNDGTSNSASATVSVTVTSVNGTPTANPVSITTPVNTTFNGTLTGSDPENSPLTYSLGSTTAAHGTVTLNPNGTYSYVPNSNFTGSDSFTFKVSDGTSTSAQATVSVSVTSAANVPLANPVSITTAEGSAYGGTLTASGGNGQPLTFSRGSIAPAHGTAIVTSNGIFVYVPQPGFHGTDTFSFRVSDGTSTSAEALVNVTVTAGNNPPVAIASSFTTFTGNPVNGLLSGSDPDADNLSFQLGSVTPAHGTVTVNPNGSFVYTPAAGFSGQDSFSFTVNDGQTSSTPALVTIRVIGANHAPVVTNGSATTDQNVNYSGSLSSLATDEDGDSLGFVIISPPNHGFLSFNSNGQFLYNPDASFVGTDSFTFKATDGRTYSNLGTFSIQVAQQNSQLTLNLPSSPSVVQRNSVKVQVDPAASVTSTNSNLDFSHARITASVANLSPSDALNGRVVLSVQNQGSGSGLVRVKGTNIYYDGSTQPVARLSGGSRGTPLVISFTSLADQQTVNAVLRQLTITASKRASTGNRTVSIRVNAGGQFVEGTQTATIV